VSGKALDVVTQHRVAGGNEGTCERGRSDEYEDEKKRAVHPANGSRRE